MAQTPSTDEAAAIAAAIARFEAETAPAASGAEKRLSGWQRAALIEGVSAKPGGGDPKGGFRWLS
jgi:hypothetical protein